MKRYIQSARNRDWSMIRALGISGCVFFSVGSALESAQTTGTIGCYTGMKQADVDGNHAIDWDEYKNLIATFAQWNFDECDTAKSSESPTIRTQFTQDACSCSSYQDQLLNTTILPPVCSCSEDNATLVVPGIYREPYSRNICQSIDTLLDSVCGAMAFSPKPLRTQPVQPVDISVPVITRLPTNAPIIAEETQKRRWIPLLVSAGAVLSYLLFMVHWYRRHGHQVRKLTPQYDETLPTVIEHLGENGTEPTRVRDSTPLRVHRSKLCETPCTTVPHFDPTTLPPPYTDDDENDWNLENNTLIADSLNEIYIIEEDDVLDYGTYLDEELRPSSASTSLPDDAKIYSSRQSELNDDVDLIVSENHKYRSSSSGWMVKSFDKRRFDGSMAASTINYNDVSATQYTTDYANGSSMLYRTDLIDEEVDEYECSNKSSIEKGENISIGYSTEDDDNDDFDNDDFVGPIDIDDGQILPRKKVSKALRGQNRKKHKATKVRSVRGARAAYMKQAQALSSNSLKPIPESTFVRTKPFVI